MISTLVNRSHIRFPSLLSPSTLPINKVILHIISSFTVVANASGNERAGPTSSCTGSMSFPPLPLPPGVNGQLLLVAGRLAAAIGRYPEAVRHVQAAVRAATHSNNIAARERWANLLSVFDLSQCPALAHLARARLSPKPGS